MIHPKPSNHNASKKPKKKLSATELEVLNLIRQGLTSPEIAKKKKCSTRTIEKHRSNMIKKLQLKTSHHALLLWIQNNPHIFNT